MFSRSLLGGRHVLRTAFSIRRYSAKSMLLDQDVEKRTKPVSDELTQTDFSALNILGGVPTPTTAIDACTENGFALNSGLRIDNAAVLLLAGEAFVWRPCSHGHSKSQTSSAPLQLDIDLALSGMLNLLWPKPDILILGTGGRNLPISDQARQHINKLGIRIESQDTRNAAAQFNLLATERGVKEIAAALLPIS